jgi:hypothetical protein
LTIDHFLVVYTIVRIAGRREFGSAAAANAKTPYKTSPKSESRNGRFTPDESPLLPAAKGLVAVDSLFWRPQKDESKQAISHL